MKRCVCIVFVCLTILVNVQAQRITKANTEGFSKKSFSKIIGQIGNTYYLIRSSVAFSTKNTGLNLKGGKFEITCTDSVLKQKWAIPIDFAAYPDAQAEQAIIIGDKLALFFSALNKETGILALYCQNYSIANGAVADAVLKVDEVKQEKRRSRGVFYIEQSSSKAYLLVFHREMTSGDGEFYHKESRTPADSVKETLSWKVYDTAWNMAWQRAEANVAYVGNQQIREAGIDNTGNAYLLTSYRPAQGVPIREYKLLTTSQNSTLKEYTISISGKSINDLKMMIDEVNEQVVLGGFFSDNNTFVSSGVLYTTYSIATGSMGSIKVESFKPKLLNDFAGDRTVSRSSDLINYEVERLILRSDGGIILVAESNYVIESSNYNSYYQLYTVTFTYHYDNVLLLSVNTDGSVDWGTVLRKSQSSENDEGFYASFILFAAENQLSLIYNKSVRRRTDIMRFVVDSQGVTAENTLVPGNEELMLMPRGSKQVSATEMLIPSTDKSMPGLIKISF